MRRLAVGAAALVFGMVSAGCGGGADKQAEPALGPMPVLRAEKDIKLPLDAYRETLAQRGNTWLAVQTLGRDCMRGLGFDWQILPLAQQQDDDTANSRRYGIFIEAEVRQWGYRIPPPIKPPEPKPPSNPVTPAQMEAWSGKAQNAPIGQAAAGGGCSGQAIAKLAKGTSGAGRDLVEQLVHQASDLAEEDSRVVKAFAAWSSCMKGRGFSYKSPWDANDAFPSAGDAVPQQELVTAAADLECRQSVNLVNLWFAVESAYEQRFIEQNAQALQAYKNHLETVQHEALTVLAGR
ncbi:hypothetical protein [Yinghuangia seranimata]|uniref:hypothetical protein n=1 Tax=Yinghuangia seranimata TaxID=408067 RepID=UPI00248CB91D|nr:hypothetical protein [Yinghuangia seranimata]MDI2129204.1 hypothetical protein [Yinghuangia seranimata]